MSKTFSVLIVLLLILLSPLALAEQEAVLLTIQGNYLGLILVFMGLAFMLAELFLFSFGLLVLGGLITYLIGLFLLYNSPLLISSLAWSLIIGSGLAVFLFILLAVALAIRAQRRKVAIGPESLVGQKAEVLRCGNGKISVRAQGEIWQAKSEYSLQVGQVVRIKRVSGLELTIEPLHKKETED